MTPIQGLILALLWYLNILLILSILGKILGLFTLVYGCKHGIYPSF